MKKIFQIILAFALVTTWSCKSYVDDINIDPNIAADAPISALLNSAITATILNQEGEDARLGCLWSQQFTGVDRQYSSLNEYTVSNGSFTWNKYYIPAENAKRAAQKSAAIGDRGTAGLAKVLVALNYGTVVAGWGNAPIAQANNVLDFPNPVFDDQANAYAMIQTMLSDAITDMEAGVVPAITTFGGANWIQLAHSLKARYYLHTKNYAQAITEGQLGILDPAESFVSPHTTGTQQIDMNVYYDFGKVNREGYMDASASHLAAILDPLNPLTRNDAKTDESARFASLFVGAIGEYDLNYDDYFAANASMPFFDARETHLIIAESASRLTDDVTALQFLNNVRGVNLAVFGGKYDAYDATDFGVGGMAAVAGKTAAESLRYNIVEEKYCTLVGQHEVFNDIKRTKNELGLVPVTGSQLPARFLVPVVEQNSNSNAPAPVGLFVPTPVNN